MFSGWLKQPAVHFKKGHQVDSDISESLFEKPQKYNSYELPNVETAPILDGVDLIAFFPSRSRNLCSLPF
jgi:hypothetical protein